MTCIMIFTFVKYMCFCVLLPLIAALSTSQADLQHFLSKWFAWSSALLLSLPLNLCTVVKSVPMAHLHAEPSVQPRTFNGAAKIMFLIEHKCRITHQMILFCPFAASLVCFCLSSTSCKYVWFTKCWDWRWLLLTYLHHCSTVTCSR